MQFFSVFLQEDIFNPATLPGAIFYLVLFILIAWGLSIVVRMAAARLIRRGKHGIVDPTAGVFLRQFLQALVFIIAAILYIELIPPLRAIGAALIAGAGVASLIIGIAAQNTLGNIIAGFALLLYRPFEIGDRIRINTPGGPETGTIESLSLGYTIILTADKRRVVVPNGVMATSITINLTHADARRTAIIEFRIGYASDIEKARGILIELATGNPRVEKVLDCPVTRLADSAVVLSLRAECTLESDTDALPAELLEKALSRFRQAGIEIPYPYNNVILRQ